MNIIITIVCLLALSPLGFTQTMGIIDTAADSIVKIQRAELRDTQDGNMEADLTFVLCSDARPSMTDLRVTCFIYEQNTDGKIVLTQSKVSSKWIETPIDWKDSNAEKLTLQYQTATRDADRKYAGWIVGIYYQGKLQSSWTTKEVLLAAFPLPMQMTAVATGHKSKQEWDFIPEDYFLGIYKLFQEGEAAFKKSDFDNAKTIFEKVISDISTLKERQPEWQPQVVDYRLKSAKQYLAEINNKK